jgi:ribonuclease R
MGDKVMIRVVAASLDKRQLDYEWVMDGSRESDVRNKKAPGKRTKTPKSEIRDPK